MGAMYDDYRATGKCNLAMARRSRASSRSLHWGLTKNGYLTESFNRGYVIYCRYEAMSFLTLVISRILKMFERGLMNHWMHIYQPDIHKCVDVWNRLVQRKLTDMTSLPPLSLKSMTGAFTVLLCGSGTSFLIFVIEIIFKSRSTKTMDRNHLH